MKYDYIVLDDNNYWVATCDTAKQALQVAKKHKEINKDEVSEVWVYKSQQIL